LNSNLPPLFIVEARRAVPACRFLPAMRDGEAVAGSITLPFRFRGPEAGRTPLETGTGAEVIPLPTEVPAVTAAPPPEPELAAGEEAVAAPAQEAPAADERPEPALGSSLVLVEAGFGREARRSGPVDPAASFREGERVYFWTRIAGGRKDQQVLHVWNLGTKTVQIIELPIVDDPWSTWSYKTLFEGMLGEWTVEVWDENGTLIGSRSFTCLAAE
jgi:hypothetical protein